MTLYLPEGLRWLGWIAGSAWPDGDEDKMWEIARAWEQASKDLNGVIGSIELAKKDTLAAYTQGTGTEQIGQLFDAYLQGDQSIKAMADLYHKLYESSFDMGTELQSTKLNVIISLCWLAAELIWAWLFPVTAPAAEAAAYGTTRSILRFLEDRLQNFIETKITMKIGLATRAEVSAAVNAGTRTSKYWIFNAKGLIRNPSWKALFPSAKGAAVYSIKIGESVIVAGVMNASIQVGQIAAHKRRHFNAKEFGASLMGAGASTIPTREFARVLGRASEKTLFKGMAHSFPWKDSGKFFERQNLFNKNTAFHWNTVPAHLANAPWRAGMAAHGMVIGAAAGVVGNAMGIVGAGIVTGDFSAINSPQGWVGATTRGAMVGGARGVFTKWTPPSPHDIRYPLWMHNRAPGGPSSGPVNTGGSSGSPTHSTAGSESGGSSSGSSSHQTAASGNNRPAAFLDSASSESGAGRPSSSISSFNHGDSGGLPGSSSSVAGIHGSPEGSASSPGHQAPGPNRSAWFDSPASSTGSSAGHQAVAPAPNRSQWFDSSTSSAGSSSSVRGDGSAPHAGASSRAGGFAGGESSSAAQGRPPVGHGPSGNAGGEARAGSVAGGGSSSRSDSPVFGAGRAGNEADSPAAGRFGMPERADSPTLGRGLPERADSPTLGYGGSERGDSPTLGHGLPERGDSPTLGHGVPRADSPTPSTGAAPGVGRGEGGFGSFGQPRPDDVSSEGSSFGYLAGSEGSESGGSRGSGIGRGDHGDGSVPHPGTMWFASEGSGSVSGQHSGPSTSQHGSGTTGEHGGSSTRPAPPTPSNQSNSSSGSSHRPPGGRPDNLGTGTPQSGRDRVNAWLQNLGGDGAGGGASSRTGSTSSHGSDSSRWTPGAGTDYAPATEYALQYGAGKDMKAKGRARRFPWIPPMVVQYTPPTAPDQDAWIPDGTDPTPKRKPDPAPPNPNPAQPDPNPVGDAPGVVPGFTPGVDPGVTPGVVPGFTPGVDPPPDEGQGSAPQAGPNPAAKTVDKPFDMST